MNQQHLKNLASIALGAWIGTILRYYISTATEAIGFPLGTLIVNVTGSFILGFFMGLFVYKFPKEWVKVGLTTGLCGGYTTMSTFAADSMIFIINASWWGGALYLIFSVFGGLFCAWSGYICGQLVGRKSRQGGTSN